LAFDLGKVHRRLDDYDLQMLWASIRFSGPVLALTFDINCVTFGSFQTHANGFSISHSVFVAKTSVKADRFVAVPGLIETTTNCVWVAVKEYSARRGRDRPAPKGHLTPKLKYVQGFGSVDKVDERREREDPCKL
jgi:hypothetical protein